MNGDLKGRVSPSPVHAASAVWPWPARIPAMILAYGAAGFAVLAMERMLHSETSAGYAAIAVGPGALAAGVAAFTLSFRPRARLVVLAAVVIVALLPLGLIVLSIDFGEFRALVLERARLVAAALAGATVIATALLMWGGVIPAPARGGTA